MYSLARYFNALIIHLVFLCLNNIFISELQIRIFLLNICTLIKDHLTRKEFDTYNAKLWAVEKPHSKGCRVDQSLF